MAHVAGEGDAHHAIAYVDEEDTCDEEEDTCDEEEDTCAHHAIAQVDL